MSERSSVVPLPPIAFYSIYEISVRWGCHPADVAGWAAAGHLQVLAGIPPVNCGDETVAGLVEVPIAELMPMFRRFGPSDEVCRLRRVKPHDSKAWLKVTDPADGVQIRSSDLLLAAGPLQQFEEERDLLRRPTTNIGSNPRYDWDAMYAWADVVHLRKRRSRNPDGAGCASAGLVRAELEVGRCARRKHDPQTAHRALAQATGRGNCVTVRPTSAGQPYPPRHRALGAVAGVGGWPPCRRRRAAVSPSDGHSAAWSASGCGRGACRSFPERCHR